MDKQGANLEICEQTFEAEMMKDKIKIHTRTRCRLPSLLTLLLGLFGISPATVHAYSWFSSNSAQDEPQDSLVSPIVNRELEASVVAHGWPFTRHNVLCEAALGYYEADWKKFLDKWVDSLEENETESSVSELTGQVLNLVSDNRQDQSLLSYGLALRAYSPQCELHRGLARELMGGNGLLAANTTVNAFVHAILNDRDVLITDPSGNASELAQDTLRSVELLPGEVPWQANVAERRPIVVLYANMASPEFVEMYRALCQASGLVSFVVRHLGNVQYETNGGEATILQGYGVRLDIRNVEYRVFDDRGGGGESDEKSYMINVTSLNSTLEHQFLAGINPSMLTEDNQTALDIQAKLWKLHEARQLQSQRIPPKWQRRQLSLQAASAIVNAKDNGNSDPLLTLQDVSQNLPSVASTLVHLDVSSPELLELAAAMEELLPSSRGAILSVNGRRVPIDRPSFNVFELFHLIKEEQKELATLQGRLQILPQPALKEILAAWSMGEEALLALDGGGGDGRSSDQVVRIDVGRGWKRSIMYLNDIEKDAQYAAWPRQVQQMLFAMQFGAAPSVRRNMFTILAVMDPLDESSPEHAALLLGSQLMQSSYPARLGVLLVNTEDLDACSEWLISNEIADEKVPCPVNPLFGSATISSANDLDAFSLTTQGLHHLFASVCVEHAGDGVPPAYLQYLLQMMDQRRHQKGGPLSLKDTVLIHARVMSDLGVLSEAEAKAQGLRTLIAAQDVSDSTGDAPLYGMALRFALSRSITPGMGFVNGRPLPTASDEASRERIGQVFSEEQSHIMKLIMEGEITDTSPKSIYAKLLTGDKVYKRLHPLISDVNADKAFVSLRHDFEADSLLFPKSNRSAKFPEAVFVVEAVVDLDSTRGRDLARAFISTLDAYPAAIGEGDDESLVSLAYRILPSRASAATVPLCAIFSKAALVGASSLTALLNSLPDKPESIIEALPNISDDTRLKIMSQLDSCGEIPYLKEKLPSHNFVSANGHVYSLEDGLVGKGDIELLLAIELKRAKAVTKLLSPHLSFDDSSYYDAIAQSAAFLAQSQGSDAESRNDIQMTVRGMEEEMRLESNPFRFSWNDRSESDELRVQITAVADPISEATQRMAPLLRALRDKLELPLTLILAPRRSSDGDDNAPITSYYRFVADPLASPDVSPPKAVFTNLPVNHVLTLRMDVPEPWNVQQSHSVQDTDNLRCDVRSGCSDDTYGTDSPDVPVNDRRDLTSVEYDLRNLLVFGQCYDASSGSPPNGLQLSLSHKPAALPSPLTRDEIEVGQDGSIIEGDEDINPLKSLPSLYSDTLVMKNVGYWQLRANPGVWDLNIAAGSRGAEIFDMVDGKVVNRKLKVVGPAASNSTMTIVMNGFVNRGELLVVKRRPGYEKATLFYTSPEKAKQSEESETIHVFSLATGHLYERFLKIMMLSVTKRTSSKVKFWLFENFLSPTFKASARSMAERIGCQVEFVTYKWPEWVRAQSEKQRIIWGYKILFLDVLFPLDVKKIIYVDADQVVRGDLKELWDMDLEGAPYGYTPFCTSRESTLGFQFWRSGFWKSHLGDKPYHISALYVVDIEKFRQDLVGDILRSTYQQLSADPNSLANLDQDLPNYAQSHVPIFSLPQEWLWCESWCSDETKATAKTIDLCNNPLHKEPKVSMAQRIISGELFNESWVELDAEQERYTQEYFAKIQSES